MEMTTRRGFIGGMTAAVALAEWKAWAAAEGLPEYYAGHLAAVTEKVRTLARECGDGFWFVTDPHVKSNHCKSGRIIAELIRRTGLRRVLCGGDLPEAFGDKYPLDKAAVDFAIDRFREHWVTPIRAAGGRLYSAKGNHDFTVRHSPAKEDATRGYTYSGAAARGFIVGEWTEKDIVTNPDDPVACYYYVDNPETRLRYVVADTTDSETSGDVAWGVRYGVHDVQLKWLEEKAFGTLPAGYDAVVMHHIPVTGVVGSEKDRQLFTNLRELLERFGDRILLDLTGHEHAERQTFQNGILHVTEPCDAAYGDYINGSAPWCGPLPRKAGGTIYEQTLDAVQIDRKRGLVHFTRVGGGQDRTIHLAATTVKVGDRLPFRATLVQDGVTFACYDGDGIQFKPNPNNRYNPFVEYKNEFATITSDGLLTAIRPGPVMVLARDGKLNKEIFPVTVVPGE